MATNRIDVRYTLVYGMRLFRESGDADIAVIPPEVWVAGERAGRIAQHTIEGTKDEIRRRLMESIDAFFDLSEG